MLTHREQLEAEALLRDVRAILRNSFSWAADPGYQRKVAFEEALERYGFRKTQ